MSLKLLGDGFDIHGGGSDLVFPHHENEIAQAVGAGHEFARYWLHNGMLNVDGEKMSKSLGNFVTLVDVLDQYDPRAFRLLVLQTHYRRQMEIGDKELSDAEKALGRLDALGAPGARPKACPRPSRATSTPFRDAMDDDFDTPAALAYVFELVRDANVALDEDLRETAATAFATVQRARRRARASSCAPTRRRPTPRSTRSSRRARRRAGARTGPRPTGSATSSRARGIVVEDTPRGPEWRRE